MLKHTKFCNTSYLINENLSFSHNIMKKTCKLLYVYKKLIPHNDLLFLIESECCKMAHGQQMTYGYYAKNVIIIESQILLLYFV